MRVARFLLAVVGAMTLTSVAEAQTFTGSIPGPQTPSTWGAPPVNNCNGATSSRSYTVFNFTNLAAASNFTFTATRSSGSGISVYLYQNGFDPSWPPCANFWTNGSTGTTSATLTTPLTNYNSQFALVIVGNSASDVADVTLTVSGPSSVTAVCSAAFLSPTSITSVPSAGSTTAVSFKPPFGCGTWSASGIPGWISGVPTSGTGNANFNLVVAQNTGNARNATITIGGQSLFVSQQAQTCTYSLAFGSFNTGASSSSSSVAITTSPTCSWSASSNAGWLTGVSPTSGMGNGTVSFNVGANTGPARSGTLTIGGQTFTVNQADGCTFSPTPSTVAIGAGG